MCAANASATGLPWTSDKVDDDDDGVKRKEWLAEQRCPLECRRLRVRSMPECMFNAQLPATDGKTGNGNLRLFAVAAVGSSDELCDMRRIS